MTLGKPRVVIVGAAVLFAFTLVHRRKGTQQAVLEAPAEEQPTTLPEPVHSRIARALICACAAAGGRVVGQGRCLCQPSPALVSAAGD